MVDNKGEFVSQMGKFIRAAKEEIVVEGIETEEHIEIFRRLQGDYLQGYYYSKPLPEHEFVKYVREFNHV